MTHLLPLRTSRSVPVPHEGPDPVTHLRVVPTTPSETGGEDGSLVAEYGLLAVVAATLAAILMTWGRTALPSFFDALLDAARGLAGA